MNECMNAKTAMATAGCESVYVLAKVLTAYLLKFQSSITNNIQSSILLRFTDDSFDEHIQSTIGVDFKVKHLEVEDKRVKLTIWDTVRQNDISRERKPLCMYACSFSFLSLVFLLAFALSLLHHAGRPRAIPNSHFILLSVSQVTSDE
jgi:hypothetical protein